MRVPRKRVPLTLTRIKSLKPGTTVSDGLTPNLWIRTLPSGRQNWICRIMVNGVRRDIGLGPAPDTVTLAQAREAVLGLRRLAKAGVDPLLAKRKTQLQAKIAATTFGAVCEQYLNAHKAKWANSDRTSKEWRNSLSKHCPQLWATPIASIDANAVAAALKPSWATQNKLSHRLRFRISAIWEFAFALDYCTGKNPAIFKNVLEPRLGTVANEVKAKSHHLALSYTEVGAFMYELSKRPGNVARCLQLIYETAMRAQEAGLLTWQEVDFANRTINLPAERMKSRKPHVVVLSDQAVALLQAQLAIRIPGTQFVFPGQKPNTSVKEAAFAALLRRMRYADRMTTHGGRSSFRTWIQEMTSYPRELGEVALSHSVGSAVEMSYARGAAIERRRPMMQEWSDYISKIQRRALCLPDRELEAA